MIINGVKNLFPLTYIRPRYNGYYMDANGAIYSTRQYAVPRKLAGSLHAGLRTYSFSVNGRRNPDQERGDILYAEAKRHPSWAKEIGTETAPKSIFPPKSIADANASAWPFPPAGQVANVLDRLATKPDTQLNFEEDAPADRSYATTLPQAIKQRGYIIGQIPFGSQAIVFGSKPKVHLTLESVKSEVARLAQKSPGTQIIYVQIQGAATCHQLAWA